MAGMSKRHAPLMGRCDARYPDRAGPDVGAGGLAFAAFPGAMRRAMRDAAETPEGVLRLVGIVSAIVGIVLVWAIRGFPAINLL